MRIRQSCIINMFFLPLSSAAASTCIPRIIRTSRTNAIPIKTAALFSNVALVEKEKKDDAQACSLYEFTFSQSFKLGLGIFFPQCFCSTSSQSVLFLLMLKLSKKWALEIFWVLSVTCLWRFCRFQFTQRDNQRYLQVWYST